MSRRMFVYELPYSERSKLCCVLDATDKWEELGGEHMGFDYTYLQYIRRKSSPTDELLTSWGNQNHTVNELFILLSKMQFYRAMRLLINRVDEQYHHLLKEGEEFMNQPINKNLMEPENQNRVNQRPELGNQPYVARAPQAPAPPRVSVTPNTFEDNKDLGLNVDNLNLAENKVAKKTINEVKIQNVPLAMNGQNVDQNSNVQNNFSSGQSQAAYNPNYNPNLNPPGEPSDMQKLGQQRKLSNVSQASSVMEGCTPQISYEELETATNGWDPSCILGRGGFGTVYKGFWKNTLVAIKKLEPQKDQQMQTSELNASQVTEALRELRHLNSHRHDNILSLYGYSVTESASCLVYQYMAMGSLEDRLHCKNNTKPLTWAQRLNIMTGTARGIQFLHSLGKKPLVHGDIKSANILLDSNLEPRLGDFGLAREGPHQQYTHVKVSRVHGTKPYLPDEFLRARQFSVKVDTYSFGVVLFEVATGLRAYDDKRKEKFLKDYIVSYSDHLSALADPHAGQDYCMSAVGLLTLGRSCVANRPKDRPDMTTVLTDVQMLLSNYKNAERVKCMQILARQRSLTPTSPLEMQAFHDEMRNGSPSPQLPVHPLPTPSPQLTVQPPSVPFQIFVNNQGQQLLIPHGLSPEEAHRLTKGTGTIQLLPGTPVIVQAPPAVTVQPPSSSHPPSASPQVDDVCNPPLPLGSSDIPLLTVLGLKSDSETSVEQLRKTTSTSTSQGISTEMSSESIHSSFDTRSATPSVNGTQEEMRDQNKPEDVRNFTDFSVSLPENNHSAYLPRFPDLLGS